MALNQNIWKEFEVDGQKFWIQNVEKHQEDAVADLMAKGFRRDEPISQHTKIENPSEDAEIVKKAYIEILKSELSIVCMTKQNDVPVIAGIQCFEINSVDERIEKFRMGELLLQYMLNIRNVCEELSIDHYLVDRGLYVLPDYRKKGIGRSLLECWSLICEKVGQKVAIGIFSSKYSQAAAKRAGLIEVCKRPYEDIRSDSKLMIPLGVENHTKELLLFIAHSST